MAATICHRYGDFPIYATTAEAEWVGGVLVVSLQTFYFHAYDELTF